MLTFVILEFTPLNHPQHQGDWFPFACGPIPLPTFNQEEYIAALRLEYPNTDWRITMVSSTSDSIEVTH